MTFVDEARLRCKICGSGRTWLAPRPPAAMRGFVLQTIGLQECMVRNKEYYKDFLGSTDSAEGELLHSIGSALYRPCCIGARACEAYKVPQSPLE
jgi:hypothetical protein